MGYMFSTDANGSNSFTLDAGTLPAELPPSIQYGSSDVGPTMTDVMLGTGASPSVSTVQRSDPGISLSGILAPISATAQSLANVWTQVNTVQDNLAAAKLQRTVQEQTTALNSAKTLGALDLAQKQTAANQTIEAARINASVANDLAKVSGNASGVMSHVTPSNMILFAGLLIGAFMLYKKMGK